MPAEQSGPPLGDRAQLEAKLFEQRAKCFDHIFDAVIVTDPTGVVLDWNAGAQQLFGYGRDEIIGQHVSLLHDPDRPQAITREVLENLAKAGKWHGEYKMRCKDGRLGWVETVVVPIVDDHGRPIGTIGINRDISERIEQSKLLTHLAYHDPLTQVPNRALAFDRLEQAMARAERSGRKVGLLFVDLDGFKAINDSLGHSAGDRVLREVARRLSGHVRAGDTVARMGGDEFLVILDDVHDAEDVAEVAEKLTAVMAEPHRLDGDSQHRVQGSIGMALYPDDGDHSDALISCSDRRMYRAKAQRRGDGESLTLSRDFP